MSFFQKKKIISSTTGTHIKSTDIFKDTSIRNACVKLWFCKSLFKKKKKSNQINQLLDEANQHFRLVLGKENFFFFRTNYFNIKLIRKTGILKMNIG